MADQLPLYNPMNDRKADIAELRKDASSVVNQLANAWEAEVDVLVILAPKVSGEFAFASNADSLRIRSLLEGALNKSRDLVKMPLLPRRHPAG